MFPIFYNVHGSLYIIYVVLYINEENNQILNNYLVNFSETAPLSLSNGPSDGKFHLTAFKLVISKLFDNKYHLNGV